MNSNRIFLSHQTACLYWAHRDTYETKYARTIPTPRDFPDKSALEDVRRFVIGLEDRDLHILVHRDCRNLWSSGARLHSRAAGFPANSFRKVAKDVFVASPELCFLEAASFLGFNALVLYGLELCGGYARTFCSDGVRYKREPLTSAASLRRYVQNSPGVKGCRVAGRALRYVADGSASVRESQLAMMLTLPPRLGGFGLPMPNFNYGIEVNRPDYFHPSKNLVFHGDVVWPDAHLIVEYDGQQHGLVDNHESDKQRDHLMLEAGYQVVRFTNRQINDPFEVERLAHTVNGLAHLRRPKSSLRLDGRKTKTQREILQRCDPPWLE